jgi:TolB protein
VAGSFVILLAASCTTSSEQPTVPGHSVRGSSVVTPTGAPSRDEEPPVTTSGPDLFRVDPSTGETETILAAAGGLHEPERSPDGSRLVYQGTAADGTEQIFVLERDKRRQLTHLPGGAIEPTWSPDGTRIAFVGRAAGRDSDIVVMDANGTHLRRLTSTPGSERHPDWSPDGSRIVFDAFPDIRVVSVPGGEVTTLSNSAIRPDHGPAAYPAWSPDGRWIAFTRFDPGSINGVIGYAGLWVMPASGDARGERRLSGPYRSSQVHVAPSWSPDGGSIVVAVLGDSNGKLGIVAVRSSEITHIDTSDPLRDLSWSNEGIIGSGEVYDQPLWSTSGGSYSFG